MITQRADVPAYYIEESIGEGHSPSNTHAMLTLLSKGGSASSASNSMVSSIVSPAPSLHRSLGQNVTTFFPYSLGRDRILAPSGYNRLLSVRCNSAGNTRSALPQIREYPFGALACFGPVANFKLRVAYFGRYPPLAPVELRSVVALGVQGHPVSGRADSRSTATIDKGRRGEAQGDGSFGPKDSAKPAAGQCRTRADDSSTRAG